MDCNRRQLASLHTHELALLIRECETNFLVGIALHKLATLYEALGETAKAAHYYQQNLLRVDASRLQTVERQNALLFLANYKMVHDLIRLCLPQNQVVDFMPNQAIRLLEERLQLKIHSTCS